MKFIASSTELLSHLQAISRVISSKNSLPILDNFLFELNGNTLTMTASDIETTLVTSMEVEGVEGAGKVAVASRLLLDTLREFSEQPLSFDINDSNLALVITSSNGSYNFIGQNGDEYPRLPELQDNARRLVLPVDTLEKGIAKTLFATADDELRPVMNGIFFDMDPSGSTLVATDAQKLIAYSTKEAKVDEKSSFILHKKAAVVLRAAIDKRDDEVLAAFDNNTVEFRFGDSIMICRLIVGKFPDYRRVIPQNNSNILKIDRLQLLNAVRRVSVCANRASNHIKFELRPGQLEITAQDLGFALAAYEKIGCEYDGDELSIGFKSPHILDMLGNMQSSTVVMKFADARRAALVIPSEEEEESGKICGIMMPIVIS